LEFKRLAVLTGYNDEALMRIFKEAIPSTLVDKVWGMETPPTTLENWYRHAARFDRNWRYRQAEKKIFTPAPTVRTPHPTTTTPRAPAAQNQYTAACYNPGPYRPQAQAQVAAQARDPNAMDIDRAQGGYRRPFNPDIVCHNCKQKGHISRNC